MRKSGGAAILALLALLPANARANDLQAAKEHYQRGARAYEVGQYDEAAREFAEAYKLRDEPSILFNLAQARRLGGHREEALRTYKIFLVKVPETPTRPAVEAIIAGLEQPVRPREQDPDTELAKRYFTAGTERYEARDYCAAATEFEKARLVKPAPALDFNIARAYDYCGKTADALAAYRRYLGSNPSDAAEARARVPILEKRLQEENRATQPASPAQTQTVAQAPSPPEHRGRGKIIGGVVLGVVGLGAIAGGIATGLLAKQAGDDLTQIDRNHGVFDGSKQSAGKNEEIATGVLLGVGGAAVVTGAVLLIVGRREARASRYALAPAIGPTFAGLKGQF